MALVMFFFAPLVSYSSQQVYLVG